MKNLKNSSVTRLSRAIQRYGRQLDLINVVWFQIEQPRRAFRDIAQSDKIKIFGLGIRHGDRHESTTTKAVIYLDCKTLSNCLPTADQLTARQQTLELDADLLASPRPFALNWSRETL